MSKVISKGPLKIYQKEVSVIYCLIGSLTFLNIRKILDFCVLVLQCAVKAGGDSDRLESRCCNGITLACCEGLGVSRSSDL